MRAISLAPSLDGRRLLCIFALGALIVVLFVGLPSLIDIWNRAIDWFIGLSPHPVRLWEESPWLR